MSEDDRDTHPEAMSRAKSEFLANLSHEVRTPLHGILGLTRLLMGTPLTRDQRRYVEMTRASADILLSTIDGILDFSKIEARRITLERVPFRVRRVVEESALVLLMEAERKGLELTWRVDAGVPPRLLGDRLRLRQVLTNLVANAVKFTERGRVQVLVEVAQPEHDGGIDLRISVSDTGIGIARDRQAEIFEPFTQATSATTRRYGGTGLGLTIASELVALMGGRLEVESEPGRGSTFHFTARFGVAAPEQLESSELAESLVLSGGRRRRVLLVEDNPVNQEVAVRLLEASGHTVTVADSGQAGLDAFERGAFDVVLMDVQMPGMDGLQTTAAIRARERAAGGARIPIIAVTAHAATDDRERCLAAGMDLYLMKPLTPEALYEAIERVAPAEPALAAVTAVGGSSNPALEQKLHRLLRDHTPAMLARIRAALERGDARSLGEAAHALKGAVSNLGKNPAFEAAERLEEIARSGDLANAPAACASVEREVQALLAGGPNKT